jgi:hypothetical protein
VNTQHNFEIICEGAYCDGQQVVRKEGRKPACALFAMLVLSGTSRIVEVETGQEVGQRLPCRRDGIGQD